MKKTVAVFGAGIGGLAAAHEFSNRGYSVSIYEANSEAGGFFRSKRRVEDLNMPSEYSWHGFGPWYHNVFDIMKQIPFDDTGSLYDKALSRPIDFGIAPEKGSAQFKDSWSVNAASKMLRMCGLDTLRWTWLMAKTWTSNRRSLEHFARQKASAEYRPILSNLGWRTWRATFGPWIGSDWTNCSLHTMGEFFRKLFISKPSHFHREDAEGPAWFHSEGNGWLLLKGPSSEFWFDKWIAHLREKGVRFFWKQPLTKFDYDGKKITRALVASGDEVGADVFVLATSPFAAWDILKRTPELVQKDELRLFGQLIQDGPHTQVSFRIAFSEKIAWQRKRAVFIIADSEFNITICPVDQVWEPSVDLGEGIRSLWTGTACVSTVPGRIYGLPIVSCTKEQFIEEVKAQLFACEALNTFIKEANDGRGVENFPIVQVEVWHEWRFSSDGIQTHQPKWVTTTNTQQYQPTQLTPVPNLVLAGAHTKTEADVWSIEGAVESGRRAAKAIEPEVKVLPQYRPWWIKWTTAADDVLFSFGLPHVLTLSLIITLVIIGWFIG